ncbi:MAG: phosphoribosylformylglycinamidine synthase subunit PurQ, partial [Eggerthellaceae bacterium]|nr:phosphoribosylformylglycinamidine synthase subunit PurQ [Eggerthellaceae bacterium]
INVASKKGLGERFDSTIGAATVLMPFGGACQLTPAQAMVAKLPVDGTTTTCSAMAWGFNPYISEKSPYAGAYIAVVESIAKLIATGFTRSSMYLTFQEYFEKLADDPIRWGKPVAALLGALDAQLDMEIGSIGGKDSMSGSFNELDVPPTLVSFAVATGKANKAISPEFKAAGHKIILLKPHAHASIDNAPDSASFHAIADYIELLHSERAISAIMTPGYGGIAESLFKMAIGNRIGAKIQAPFDIFDPAYGSFIIECDNDFKGLQSDKFDLIEMGTTLQEYELIINSEHIDLAHLQDIWESVFSDIMPYKAAGEKIEQISSPHESTSAHTALHIARPRVIIPVFPGTNCEYDTAAAFEKAGGVPEVFVVNNLTPHAIAESARLLAEKISQSQIMMIPGGFSGGDEPDGSAKFITAFLRNPYVTDAIHTLLNERDGLMLGICNGFQALVKLGLVPFGEIRDINESYPTLTFNEIGRHQSRLVRTRISSVKSPWLSKTQVGDIHTIAISHGEGRFVANEATLAKMIHNGQIATQYCDESGQPSMDLDVNPNGSILAIEGITSPDGRVFGKMGHSERVGSDLYANIPRKVDQPLFEGGVSYFE